MVVLAAAIVTKNGKALVSRQFVDMTRIRIEGLLAAFPKLIGSGKQHTYVETENVRYVYQPLETLYLVLVTNKASNILEDLEILRLCGKVVPEYVMPLEEEMVTTAAFDLLFAFDEVISLGYKENVTVTQVRQNLEMESHEEKLHKMIIQSKINETKDLMKKKALEIEKSKIEAAKGGRSLSAYGPSSISGGSFGRGGDVDSGPAFSRPEPAVNIGYNKPSAAAAKDRGPKKGMQLGKSKMAGRDFLESLKAEGEVMEDVPTASAAASAGPAALPSEPVYIAVEEKLSVTLNKDGGLENMEVQGTMALQVLAEDSAHLRVVLESGDTTGYQFKTHPNIDKALHASQNTLGLKDPERPFPTGAPLGVLKWRMQTRDESLVPLTINCWPSVSGGDSYVNIEYESSAPFDLHKVHIAIPLPALHQAPQVNQIDDGDWRYDSRKSVLVWEIDLIDHTNKSGAMEFVVPATDPSSFFPIEVDFSASKTLCDVKIVVVESTQTGQPVKYGSKTSLVTDGYSVE